MHEIEAKIRITEHEFRRLKKELDKIAVFEGETVKSDTYYNNPRSAYIRMREESGKSVLTLKNKTNAGGVESNLELEWGVKDAKKWSDFLKSIGIAPSMSKTKKSETYHLNGFHIELNSVGKLGHFLEIEKTVKSSEGVRKTLRSPSDRSQNQKTKKELIGLFKNLGFDKNRFESKGYLKLLEETGKNV